MLLLLLLHSITAPSVPCGARIIILGAIPPALKHLATVKLWLSQPHIDQIMQPARPVAQRCCIAHIRRVALQLLAQVACTLLAGVEVPQCQDETSHGVLLLQGGVVWVVRCHAVQQRPGGPPQLQYVRRAGHLILVEPERLLLQLLILLALRLVRLLLLFWLDATLLLLLWR